MATSSQYQGPTGRKLGFTGYLDNQFGSSGPRKISGRDGKVGAVFSSGPMAGMTRGQGYQKARDEYARMGDGQRMGWENKANDADILSSREKSVIQGAGGAAYASAAPVPPKPATPPANATAQGALPIPKPNAWTPAVGGRSNYVNKDGVTVAQTSNQATMAPDPKDPTKQVSVANPTTQATLETTKSGTDMTVPAGATNVTKDFSGNIIGYATTGGTKPGTVDVGDGPKNLAQENARMRAENDAAQGLKTVVGSKDANGNFVAPSRGGELLGVKDGRPTYALNESIPEKPVTFVGDGNFKGPIDFSALSNKNQTPASPSTGQQTAQQPAPTPAAKPAATPAVPATSYAAPTPEKPTAFNSMTPEQQSADIKARQARMMQASNQRPTARRA